MMLTDSRPSAYFIAEGSIRIFGEQPGNVARMNTELVFVEVVFGNIHTEAQTLIGYEFFEFS